MKRSYKEITERVPARTYLFDVSHANDIGDPDLFRLCRVCLHFVQVDGSLYLQVQTPEDEQAVFTA